ncbi:Lipoprotein-releasing system transmembrane protein LolC [Aliarcobacter thereius]|uniref:Lipoprotein-releasing system transmembrane protein LolC n=1 Tax=Aliarcobacter thereius LMG 24486 TaxID=1032240 RepID=A0A1C7WSQ9_9BACT|nr:ABC transporter permease [Aliarcobacter thereius]OCL87104.1 Lipoprotein-releasing system transmembrane protein LolC [Aliarcobacter thereius]OCL91287.1 Lipoprotein-releasing system transmembrane protein LolC [Aliarcobacter thereius]OCL95877.1 Lipoprotein-releasing system transmembrane protein LolC [Aliarcobacter thereius LMG 24486]QBF16150.1 lipoprotein releasing system, transmembrane protein, LolC/E family [Aliarcobacter thereius LMG 24486]TLS94512.1 ABC transporter permease [Aliarcobacter 
MNKKLINFIVRKYLKFDKKNPFISISAILAFFGVAIGVMVLILSMAIMNGTSKEFEKKLFTMNYPLTIYGKTSNAVDKNLLISLQKEFKDLKFSPFISTQAIVQSSDNISGGVVFGVDANLEKEINPIYKDALKDLNPNKYDLITGIGIKDKLYLFEDSKVTMYFTELNAAGFSMMPKMKRFEYISSFSSGLSAYDKAYMYTSIEALQTLLNKDKNIYDGIHIYSNDAFKDIEKIKNFLGHFSDAGVVGWWQQNGNFFAAMKMEKTALFIVLMLIILVASLNIISSLLMTVMSRRKEIALLLSMGASSKEIKSIFLRVGISIGFGGIILGIILGFIGYFLLNTFDIVSLPADVYGSAKLPLDLAMSDFISIIVGAIIIVFLSSYYPAKKATNIDVIDVLRNE